MKTRKEILADIRGDTEACQPHPLIADVLMKILEVLLDMRDQLEVSTDALRGRP